MKKVAVHGNDKEPEGLPTLFARMADDLGELFDAKATLLKIELREEVQTYVRGLAMIAVGAVGALIGLALLNVAIAFVVSTLFQNTGLSQPTRYALGFTITALVYLVIGGVLIIVSKNRIAEQPIVPERTVAEFGKDIDRIEEGIEGE